MNMKKRLLPLLALQLPLSLLSLFMMPSMASAQYIEQFEKSTKKYLDRLFSNIPEEKFIVLDQGVYPCDFDIIDRYFTAAKMVIVDRDLRDVYISSMERHGGYDPDVTAYFYDSY